jgi:hypothetical protein
MPESRREVVDAEDEGVRLFWNPASSKPEPIAGSV